MMEKGVTEPTTTRINPLAMLLAGLVIGMIVGYVGRPLVTPQSPDPTPVTPAGTASPPLSEATPPGVMDAVVAQTRHFKGDPEAPVTVIEFSDFQ